MPARLKRPPAGRGLKTAKPGAPEPASRLPGQPVVTKGRREPLAPPFGNVLEMIGRTPMIEFRRLDTGQCRLFGKLELMNPAGSIKDRIGLSMIEAAERDGRLNAGGDPPPTIIEATAGNTGLGLALVAGQKGYRIKVVMPDKMSQEKIQHLRAMGAEVILTRSDVEKGHPEYYQDLAATLAKKTPNSLYVDQFNNPDNALAHYTTTGPEIEEQMAHVGGVDAVVVGVGSAGTLAGLGRYFAERGGRTKLVLADPEGSILAPLKNTGKAPKPGSWLVEGMGEDFVPKFCDLNMVSDAISVSDAESFFAARDLLKMEGILAGSSTGCLLSAALTWCRRQTSPKNVVTIVPDSGAKYLSKMYNDFWMMDNGFTKRERTNDLRDLIARRHTQAEDFTLRPTDPLRQAIRRMQLYGVSQMVVMDDADHVIGIMDEGDILIAVAAETGQGSPADSDGVFEKPVSDFMTRRLETVRPEAPVSALLPIFRADRVAIVVDQRGVYHGLITKIDMINYLRQQLAR